MKLYYGLTNYHLLCSILHKFIYNSNNKTAFVASQGILKNRVEILKKLQIFDEVYYLEDTPVRDGMFNQLIDNSKEENIKYISNLFIEKYEKLLPFHIEDFDEFYLVADHGVFGIYLLMKKCKYTYLEDGRGIYSNWEILDNLLKIKNPGIRIMSKYYGAYGRNNLIKNKYVAFDSQKPNYDLTDCIDFDVNHLLDEISEEQLKSILTVFNVKNYDIKTNKRNALVLTQRFSTYKMLENDECVLLYALLCDIFAKDCNVFLKPHPADKTDYSYVFKNEILIEKEMPSELIKFIIKDKFDIGICTFSTSINSLKNYIKQIYNFDESIVNYKKDLFKNYTLSEIADKLKLNLNDIKKEFLVSEKDFNGANLVVRINIEMDNKYLPNNLLNNQEILYMKVTDINTMDKLKRFKVNNTFSISQVHISISTEDINYK